MSVCLRLFFIVFCIIDVVLCDPVYKQSACYAAINQRRKLFWSIHLNADSSLNDYALRDLTEMRTGFSQMNSNDIGIVILVDAVSTQQIYSFAKYDCTIKNVSVTFSNIMHPLLITLIVDPETNVADFAVVAHVAEHDMSTYTSISSFISMASTILINYKKSKRFIIEFWGHSLGIYGLGSDITSPSPAFTNSIPYYTSITQNTDLSSFMLRAVESVLGTDVYFTVGSALQVDEWTKAVFKSHPLGEGVQWDIFISDSCRMGELAALEFIAPVTKFFIGGPTNIPASGLDYKSLILSIPDISTANTSDLVAIIVKNGFPISQIHQVAGYDTSKVSDTVESISSFFQMLRSRLYVSRLSDMLMHMRSTSNQLIDDSCLVMDIDDLIARITTSAIFETDWQVLPLIKKAIQALNNINSLRIALSPYYSTYGPPTSGLTAYLPPLIASDRVSIGSVLRRVSNSGDVVDVLGRVVQTEHETTTEDSCSLYTRALGAITFADVTNSTSQPVWPSTLFHLGANGIISTPPSSILPEKQVSISDLLAEAGVPGIENSTTLLSLLPTPAEKIAPVQFYSVNTFGRAGVLASGMGPYTIRRSLIIHPFYRRTSTVVDPDTGVTTTANSVVDSAPYVLSILDDPASSELYGDYPKCIFNYIKSGLRQLTSTVIKINNPAYLYTLVVNGTISDTPAQDISDTGYRLCGHFGFATPCHAQLIFVSTSNSDYVCSASVSFTQISVFQDDSQDSSYAQIMLSSSISTHFDKSNISLHLWTNSYAGSATLLRHLPDLYSFRTPNPSLQISELTLLTLSPIKVFEGESLPGIPITAPVTSRDSALADYEAGLFANISPPTTMGVVASFPNEQQALFYMEGISISPTTADLTCPDLLDAGVCMTSCTNRYGERLTARTATGCIAGIDTNNSSRVFSTKAGAHSDALKTLWENVEAILPSSFIESLIEANSTVSLENSISILHGEGDVSVVDIMKRFDAYMVLNPSKFEECVEVKVSIPNSSLADMLVTSQQIENTISNIAESLIVKELTLGLYSGESPCFWITSSSDSLASKVSSSSSSEITNGESHLNWIVRITLSNSVSDESLYACQNFLNINLPANAEKYFNDNFIPSLTSSTSFSSPALVRLKLPTLGTVRNNSDEIAFETSNNILMAFWDLLDKGLIMTCVICAIGCGVGVILFLITNILLHCVYLRIIRKRLNNFLKPMDDLNTLNIHDPPNKHHKLVVHYDDDEEESHFSDSSLDFTSDTDVQSLSNNTDTKVSWEINNDLDEANQMRGNDRHTAESLSTPLPYLEQAPQIVLPAIYIPNENQFSHASTSPGTGFDFATSASSFSLESPHLTHVFSFDLKQGALKRSNNHNDNDLHHQNQNEMGTISQVENFYAHTKKVDLNTSAVSSYRGFNSTRHKIAKIKSNQHHLTKENNSAVVFNEESQHGLVSHDSLSPPPMVVNNLLIPHANKTKSIQNDFVSPSMDNELHKDKKSYSASVDASSYILNSPEPRRRIRMKENPSFYVSSGIKNRRQAAVANSPVNNNNLGTSSSLTLSLCQISPSRIEEGSRQK